MLTPYCSDISYHKVTEFPELLWDTEQRWKTRDMNADVALLASPPLSHVLQTCKREPCRRASLLYFGWICSKSALFWCSEGFFFFFNVSIQQVNHCCVHIFGSRSYVSSSAYYSKNVRKYSDHLLPLHNIRGHCQYFFTSCYGSYLWCQGNEL